MAQKVLPFKYNRDNLINKYKELVYLDDAYETTLVFNRIMDEKEVSLGSLGMDEKSKATTSMLQQFEHCLDMLEDKDITSLYLRQATLYGRLNTHGMEVDCLLKVLRDESFVGYDPVAVLNRLSTFFGFLIGIDVYDYYLKFLRNRYPDDERLQFVQKPLEKKLNNELHFVNEGDYSYSCVVNKLSQGDYAGAINEIGEALQGNNDDIKVKNIEIAMMLSMGLKDEAREKLEYLEKLGCEDTEFFANYYQLAKLDNSIAPRIIKLMEELPSSRFGYDLTVILASLYVIAGEHKKAITKLNTIQGIKKDGREALKLLAICYFVVGEKSKLTDVLKKISVLYPYDVWARYYLIREDFDLVKNVEKFESSVVAGIKKYLRSETRGINPFNKKTRSETIFLFKLLEEINNYTLSKDIIEKIYNSKYIGVLLDALSSIQTSNVISQLILQVFIENKYSKDFYMLRDCELAKYSLKLPNLFLKDNNEDDKEKKQFLLSCYAQTYSLLFFLGFDVNDLEKTLDDALTWFYKQELLNDEYLHQAEYVVYILSSLVYPENDYIEHSFKYINKEIRDNLLKIAKKLR